MEQPGESLDSGTDTPAADESITTTPEAAPPEDDLLSPAPVEADTDEEIEHDGEKYKVPKKLKDAFLRQQDYTQKTQTVAEQRKAVEAQAAQLKAAETAQRQNIADYAQAFALEAQLKQYQQINWPALEESDPVKAMSLNRQMRELQDQRGQLIHRITQKQQQQHLEAQRATAKRLEEGRAVLAREIKNWSPETAKELASYGKEIGFGEEELMQINDPRIVKLLHKASQFDQLIKKQATAKAAPTPQEKPVTRITASAGTATKDPSQLSPKEFAAWRRATIAKR